MKSENFLRSTISEKTFTFLFEVLLWINPTKSLIFVSWIHFGLFFLYYLLSKGILCFLSVCLLLKLWTPIWNSTIWPSIQLPEMARIDDWLTLDPQIPPYAESIKIISRYVDDLFLPLEQLLVLRKSDPKKYVVYASGSCALMVLIGQKVSGFWLFYSIVLSFLILPMALKVKILSEIEGENKTSQKVPKPQKVQKSSPPPKPLPKPVVTIQELEPAESSSEYSESEDDGGVALLQRQNSQ